MGRPKWSHTARVTFKLALQAMLPGGSTRRNWWATPSRYKAHASASAIAEISLGT